MIHKATCITLHSWNIGRKFQLKWNILNFVTCCAEMVVPKVTCKIYPSYVDDLTFRNLASYI
jgi:hypothetical protein